MAQVQIYFGSQTGTAECFADEIAEEAEEQGIQCEVIDLQAFNPETFKSHKLVLLVVSTYGEGEPTDNAVQFHKWASDPRNDGALKGQRFTVMGLGDMNYTKFNNMGMMTDQSLERLGGKRVYQRGVGDDSQDIAADFQAWKTEALWKALKAAIADISKEGGFEAASAGAGGNNDAEGFVPPPRKTEVQLFYAQEEADGAAKDVCDLVEEQLKKHDADVVGVQSLSDRKALDVVKKMAKRSIAVVITDCSAEGLCGAGRKIVRNMNIDLDSGALADKELSLAFLVVGTSTNNATAAASKEAIEKGGQTVPKAFDRAGVKSLKNSHPTFLDAGVDDVQAVAASFAAAVAAGAVEAAAGIRGAGGGAKGTSESAGAGARSKKVKMFFAGDEAHEALDALAPGFPNAAPDSEPEEATLQSLAGAAKDGFQVVLAVECGPDGDLADAARGLAVQLGAAPPAVKMALQKLHFALLAVAGTHYGNAGERASAQAMRDQLTAAATPVAQALQKAGATCVATTSLDLQDASPESLGQENKLLSTAFAASATQMNGQAANTAANATPAAAAKPDGPAVAVPLQLKMAGSAQALGNPLPCEGSEVLSRFYFEATKTKILKVRELRQQPDATMGFSTVEIEIDASVGSLKDYTLGGTLSLLPENSPGEVEATLRLLGLPESTWNHQILWAPKSGETGGKIKVPFPTPCSLKEALARYCDLSKPPSKKMLQALEPKLPADSESKSCVSKILGDAESQKLLHSGALCLSMAEFWGLLGVTKIDPTDFLLHCPRQKAREFTIASTPKATPNRITLCVSLTSSDLPNAGQAVAQLIEKGSLPKNSSLPENRPRFLGTCSQWLTSRVKSGTEVLVKQRASALQLPEKDVPVVMVAAGAGVAPFRGFWEELRRGQQAAPAALFFGCRHPEQDWIYRDDMNSAVKLNTGCGALARMQVGPKRPLAALFTAFSRPGDGKEGVYVQKIMKDQKMSLKHWMEKMDGVVYICGSSAMGHGALDSLAEVLEGGKDKVDELRKQGRIIAEMWG